MVPGAWLDAFRSSFAPLWLMLALGCTAPGPSGPAGALRSEGAVEQPAVAAPLDCAALIQAMNGRFKGLTSRKEGQGYRFELTYLPKEVMACRIATKKDGSVLEALRDTTVMINDRDQYLLRIIPMAGPSLDGDTMTARLNEWLSTGLERRIHAFIDGDSVGCAFAHVEAAPSSSPVTTVWIGFDHLQDKAERQVVLRGIGTADMQDLRFEYGAGSFDAYAQWIGNISPSRP